MKPGLSLTILLVSASTFAQTRDVSRYERVLLPIVGSASAPGANASLWATQLWIRNKGSEPLDVFPMSPNGCCCSVGCFSTMRRAPALSAGGIGYANYPTEPAYFYRRAFGGAFLFVERGRASELQVSLHVTDTVRRPVGLGTRLPTVLESGFFTTAAQVLGVPITPRARVTLRVYDRDSVDGAEVSIRVSQAVQNDWYTPRKQVVDDVIRLTYDPASDVCDFWGCPQVKFRPAYGQIADLLAAYPQLASVPHPYGFHIEVTPLTPGIAIWPMVSVTDNDTNLITIYTAD